MPADQNKHCTLINKTGKDIAIVVAIGYDETAGSNAVVTANGQLEVLKTSGGNTVIKNGDSDSVVLDHSYKGEAGEKGDVQNYDLVISDSNWLYPLVNLPVAFQSDNGSSGFAPQSLSSIGTAMDQAFDFYQIVSAYPDSQLTTDYTTALQAANNAALAKANGTEGAGDAALAAIEETVSAFFKTTKEYGQVTLADMVAADRYYKNFPAVWAQYKNSIDYYIYTSDDKTAGFAGILSLEKSGPVDPSRPNGGYTCTFAPAVNPADADSNDVDTGKAIALTYAKGLFVDDPKLASPKIALKGSFLLARVFTGNQDDNKIIIVMSGNINGTVCIGFDFPQGNIGPEAKRATAIQTTSSDLEKYWNTLLHPKNQQQLIISVLTLAGAILLIPAMAGAVYGVYRAIKYRAAVNEALSREIVEHTRAEMEAREVDDLEGVSGEWDLRFGEWLGKYFVEFNPKNIEGYHRVLENDGLANKLIEALELQKEGLQEAMQFSGQMSPGDVGKIQDALGTTKEAIDILRNSPRTELEKALPEQFTAYKSVTATVMDVYYNLGSKLTQEAKDMIIENSDISQGMYKEIEDSFNKEGHEQQEEDPVAPDRYRPEEF